MLPLTWLVALAELGDSQSGQHLGSNAVRLVYQGAAGSSSSRQVHTMKTKPNLPELLIKELEEREFLQLENKVSRQFHHAVSGHAAAMWHQATCLATLLMQCRRKQEEMDF